jgi:hypothetical protein
MHGHFAPFDVRKTVLDFADAPLVRLTPRFDRVAHRGFGIASARSERVRVK